MQKHYHHNTHHDITPPNDKMATDPNKDHYSSIEYYSYQIAQKRHHHHTLQREGDAHNV